MRVSAGFRVSGIAEQICKCYSKGFGEPVIGHAAGTGEDRQQIPPDGPRRPFFLVARPQKRPTEQPELHEPRNAQARILVTTWEAKLPKL